MSRDICLYMLLIGLLFAVWGAFFQRQGKKLPRKIMSLRKKYCPDKHKESEKNARKQKLKKKGKRYKACKNICFVFSVVVFGATAMAVFVKPIVMQNKVDKMLTDLGGEMTRFNLLEASDGDKEIEDVVEEMFHVLPCWELYNVDFESSEKKRQSYVDAISEETGDKENQVLEEYVMINPKDEKASEIYQKNNAALRKIELDRVSVGSSLEAVQKGIIPPNPAKTYTSMQEAKMRWKNYYIKPDPSMLQQASKASADAAIGLSADSGAIETTVKQAGLAVNGYLCLMRYEHAGESKADCCFWIAKILRILSETMPKEWEGLVEHCEMLSYAFCELGVRYLDELNEKNNHAGELRLLHEEMDVRTR